MTIGFNITLFWSVLCILCIFFVSTPSVKTTRYVWNSNVSTMSNQSMVKPVYHRNRDLQSYKRTRLTDFDLLKAVQRKVNDIKCIQLDRDLWRIYLNSRESRQVLVAEGFELQQKTINVFDTNPFSAGTEKPDEEVLRVTIRGVPLSVDDECVIRMLNKFGAKLTSEIKYEKIRNPSTKKMADILNGNRFAYIHPLPIGKFLPKTSFCAGLKCSIFHHGQPKRERNLRCTNCWGDDHLRHQCEYEKCCKVCHEPGHKPGSEDCRHYENRQKDVIAFGGKDDPLSNFYECEIDIFGFKHPTSEHAFQYAKAMRSGDIMRAMSIREATTPLEAKQIGKQVTTSDQWEDTKEDVMREIIEKKFDQCKELKDELSKIEKPITIVEAVYDDYWGSGLDKLGTIHTKQRKWPGKNALGKIFADLIKNKKINTQTPNTRSRQT